MKETKIIFSSSRGLHDLVPGVFSHYTGKRNREEGKEDLFTLHDNVEDPFQLKNVAGEKPEVVKRLMEIELVPWLRKIRDPWLGG